MTNVSDIVVSVQNSLIELDLYADAKQAIDFINKKNTDYEVTVEIEPINKTDLHTELLIYSLVEDKITTVYSGTDVYELLDKIIMLYKAII